MFLNKPHTINDLKRIIEDEIKAISPEIFSNEMQNVLNKANQCETENDEHLKNVIFKDICKNVYCQKS